MSRIIASIKVEIEREDGTRTVIEHQDVSTFGGNVMFEHERVATLLAKVEPVVLTMLPFKPAEAVRP